MSLEPQRLDAYRNAAEQTAREQRAIQLRREGLLDYSATKSAIHAFTKALAANLVDKGIRVNAVAPGPVWTPLNPADKDAEATAKFG